MSVSTINEMWHLFRESAIPKEAPPSQIKDCKRMFFAGFHASLLVLRDQVAALPDDDAQRALQSLHKQCEGFTEAVRLGAA